MTTMTTQLLENTISFAKNGCQISGSRRPEVICKTTTGNNDFLILFTSILKCKSFTILTTPLFYVQKKS